MPRFSEEGAPAGIEDFFVFASPTALAASSEPDAVQGSLASVGVVQNIYRLDLFPNAATLAANDVVNIVVPVAPVGAVWTRLGGILQSAAFVTDWYLDSAAGSDAADGSIGAPLKTLGELAKRLSGVVVQVVMRVHLAAGNYDAVEFDIEFGNADALAFIIQGAFTSSAPVALSTVTTEAPGSNTRGAITAATTFVDATRLRLTSTTTPAYTGAMAYVTRVLGAGSANVTEWAQISNELVGTTTNQAFPVATDQYVVDTLQANILGPIRIRGVGKERTRVMIRDCKITPQFGGCDQFYGQASNLVTGATIYACDYQADCNWQDCRGQVFVTQIRGQCLIEGGQVNPGALIVRSNLVQLGGVVNTRGEVQVKGGGIALQRGAQWQSSSSPLSIVDSASGVTLADASFMHLATAVLWGDNNTLATGISVGMNCCVGIATGLPVLVATTNQVLLNGVPALYSASLMNATNGAVYGALS